MEDVYFSSQVRDFKLCLYLYIPHYPGLHGGPVCNKIESHKLLLLLMCKGVSGVRFKSPVTPGDMLCMEMELLSFDERLGFATMKGKAYVGGRVCVQVEEFTFALAR